MVAPLTKHYQVALFFCCATKISWFAQISNSSPCLGAFLNIIVLFPLQYENVLSLFVVVVKFHLSASVMIFMVSFTSLLLK